MQHASRPSTSDLTELLEEATSRGCTIVVLPGQHSRHEPPLVTSLRLVFGLAPAESRALAALMREPGPVTHAALHHAMADGRIAPKSKTIGVVVCRLRRKLRPYDIKIKTICKLGYRLLPDSRAKIRELLAADIVAAVPPTGNSGPKRTKPEAA